ncbi:UNKNOWN [Stylonychia lemnae]|uniref:Uncharacterized protein n=1 Tax=Stylonychia lemnae TaxID=5949 RepID=A0A078AHE0_STYLE|nr:UNKNOWN [Stylonychia lemnae]|eukprot:CDW81669.1 UNKNOWN [Stylonychia lemnae]
MTRFSTLIALLSFTATINMYAVQVSYGMSNYEDQYISLKLNNDWLSLGFEEYPTAGYSYMVGKRAAAKDQILEIRKVQFLPQGGVEDEIHGLGGKKYYDIYPKTAGKETLDVIYGKLTTIQQYINKNGTINYDQAEQDGVIQKHFSIQVEVLSSTSDKFLSQ